MAGEKRRQGSVGPVDVKRGYLENGKEAEREAQGAQDFNKNCTSRESMSPLSRLIRSFRNSFH